MKANLQKAIRRWLPPAIYDELELIYSIARDTPQYLKSREALNRNISLRNSATQATVFLLATGPSIRDLDLSLIAGRDCFTVSNFFLHEKIGELKPKYHFFAPYHKPVVEENFLDWLREADRVLPSETKIVLGISDKEKVEKSKIFEGREIIFLMFGRGRVRTIDLRKPMMNPQTVPLVALPFSMYCGYKNVVLCGCDHDTPRYFGGDIQHFYTKGEIRTGVSDSTIWESYGIEEELRSALKVFEGYDVYAAVAKRLKITILNASKTSWLRTFDFVDLVSAVSR